VAQQVVDACKRGNRVVVVVSAMGDTTDDLFQLAKTIAPQPPRRELDMLLSAGERISMALLSMAIQNLGFEAISLTGSQSGILTNDRHFDARIIEVRPIRIQDELEKGKVVIVAGYQGMSYKREITTLGRGGSDTTAVALAAALDASACEIYSDVDGVYTADPRVVVDAKQLSSVTYEEMEEMARAGARVLHAEAIAFARKHQIALYARATGGSTQGTLVRKDLGPEQDNQTNMTVSCRKDLRWVTCSADDCDSTLQWMTQRELQPAFASWATGQSHWFFCADELPQLEEAVQELKEKGSSIVIREVSAVSLVGSDVSQDPMCMPRALKLLQSEKISDFHLALAGPLRLTFFVAPSSASLVQQKLHRTFVS